MLAQNFRAPSDLGITDTEFEALVKVLGMLEREEIYPGDDWAQGNPKELPKRPRFWMAMDYVEERCGTVACIGGWAAILMGRDPSEFVAEHWGGTPLTDLFWNGAALQMAGPMEAAIATRNFLTLGEPRWDEALAG